MDSPTEQTNGWILIQDSSTAPEMKQTDSEYVSGKSIHMELDRTKLECRPETPPAVCSDNNPFRLKEGTTYLAAKKEGTNHPVAKKEGAELVLFDHKFPAPSDLKNIFFPPTHSSTAPVLSPTTIRPPGLIDLSNTTHLTTYKNIRSTSNLFSHQIELSRQTVGIKRTTPRANTMDSNSENLDKPIATMQDFHQAFAQLSNMIRDHHTEFTRMRQEQMLAHDQHMAVLDEALQKYRRERPASLRSTSLVSIAVEGEPTKSIIQAYGFASMCQALGVLVLMCSLYVFFSAGTIEKLVETFGSGGK